LGDEETIHHIFYELFDNAKYAIKASDEEENEFVFISSTVYSDDYRLHIKNTRALIAESDRQKLFEPYFSTKTSHIDLRLTFCQHAMQVLIKKPSNLCYQCSNFCAATLGY